jgi:class 3 adenylate cyclase
LPLNLRELREWPPEIADLAKSAREAAVNHTNSADFYRSLITVSTWEGDGGDAAKAAMEATARDHNTVAESLGKAATSMEQVHQDAEDVSENIKRILDDAAAQPVVQINESTNEVIPPATDHLDEDAAARVAAKVTDLQQRIATVLADGERVDTDLAGAINAAAGTAKPEVKTASSLEDLLLPDRGERKAPKPGEPAPGPDSLDGALGQLTGQPGHLPASPGDPAVGGPVTPVKLDPAKVEQFKALARQAMLSDGVPPDQIEQRLDAAVATAQRPRTPYTPPEPEAMPPPGFGDGFADRWFATEEGIRDLLGVNGFEKLKESWEGAARSTGEKLTNPLGPFGVAVDEVKHALDSPSAAYSIPPPSLDARVQDLVAVMRAEAVDRAVITGWSEGGTMAAFFAATYPERTEGLILGGTFASFVRRDDHPWAPTAGHQMRALRAGPLIWGAGELAVRVFAPSMRGQPGFRRWAARYERGCISRWKLASYGRLLTEIDIRHVLPSIYAPTLVMHARGDRVAPFQSGRYLADHIVGARFVELPTDDHVVWFGARDIYLDAMQQFLTGTRPNADHSRKLATVLFTDIVDSTVHASRVGDAGWGDLLDRHDDLCHSEIGICGGRWIKSTGDGLLATFDSPSRAIRCAWALTDRIRSELGIEIRAGLHTGEIETRGDHLAGMTVHQAARIQGIATNSEVLVSSSVSNLVAGSGIALEGHGTHTLKGIAEPCELYRVTYVAGG